MTVVWPYRRKLADQSGDDREISFLFQRLSVLIQRYNAILLHDCFVKEEEVHSSLIFVLFLYCIAYFFHSPGIEYRGPKSNNNKRRKVVTSEVPAPF